MSVTTPSKKLSQDEKAKLRALACVSMTPVGSPEHTAARAFLAAVAKTQAQANVNASKVGGTKGKPTLAPATAHSSKVVGKKVEPAPRQANICPPKSPNTKARLVDKGNRDKSADRKSVAFGATVGATPPSRPRQRLFSTPHPKAMTASGQQSNGRSPALEDFPRKEALIFGEEKVDSKQEGCLPGGSVESKEGGSTLTVILVLVAIALSSQLPGASNVLLSARVLLMAFLKSCTE